MRTYIPDCPQGRCSEKLWQPLPKAAVSLRGSLDLGGIPLPHTPTLGLLLWVLIFAVTVLYVLVRNDSVYLFMQAQCAFLRLLNEYQ